MPRVFITILLLFGTLVAGFFYLGPEWSTFGALRNEIANLSQIGVELDEITEDRNVLIDLINTISADDLRRIDQSLPDGPDAAGFLVSLETLTARHGVVLKSVDLASFTLEKRAVSGQPTPGGVVLAPKPVRPIKEFPITMAVSGTYAAFKSFLADLERNLRLVDVESYSFSAPSGTEIINFMIKAKTYYQ